MKANAKTQASQSEGAEIKTVKVPVAAVQEAIGAAHQLVLDREREKAGAVLRKALIKEPKGTQSYLELTRALERVATVYISEKGQVLGSFAQTLSNDRPREAIEQFLEALKLEPGHLGIIREVARLHLSLRECSKAAPHIQAAESINPFSGETRLLALQEIFCNNNLEKLSQRLWLKDIEMDSVNLFLRPLQAAELVYKKDLKKMQVVLQSWEIEFAEDPELQRAKWAFSQLSGKLDVAAAEKYISICRKLTPKLKKRLLLNPFLCHEAEAITKDIKNDKTNLEVGPSA